MAPRGAGWCSRIHLHEDNARFILLAIVMVCYMLSGAGLFMLLEREKEITDRNRYVHILEEFLDNNPEVNKTELELLLDAHAEASAAGLLDNKRERWDFAGSFYFVGTVVSTIGFGMTTPRTTEGKIALVCYGFLGCAGGILFFNLFLERIITFLAYILRAIHIYVQDRDLKRKGLVNNVRRNSEASETSSDNLDSWKPSVYWVMVILVLSAATIACCASAMYQPVEEWSYFDSIYFCFVAFATIGFGDLVVSQNDHYENVHLYRFGNFIFLVVGCCCTYSLFNVTSIVIKQVLNWIIRKLDCNCCYKPKPRGRRNAITPGHLQKNKQNMAPDLTDVDSNYDSEGSRRGSNEMISMKDFLQHNKISLAMMQKQLYETAQRGAFKTHESGGFQGGVGPLAIVSKTLGQDDA